MDTIGMNYFTHYETFKLEQEEIAREWELVSLHNSNKNEKEWSSKRTSKKNKA